jgi:hypothetical protein
LAVVRTRGRHRTNRYAILCGLEEEEKAALKERLQLVSKKPPTAVSGFLPQKIINSDKTLSGFVGEKGVIAVGDFGYGQSEKPDKFIEKPDKLNQELGVKPDIALSDESRINESQIKEDINQLWQKLLSHLLANGQKALVQNWLGPCRPLKLDGNILIVGTASVDTSKYLDSRFSGLINQTLPGLIGRPAFVRFIAGGPEA